ncbi:MAG: LPS export ABC transporter permease LptF [Cereibacter sphaeroides]|uniref:LPS export ABC transporter permease LptF n=1 Tax=Cereibacter sphaeroides TaxID=1063 RepID=A0A2W5UP93_CERSP|nr:MAG: LPS export ABC transporter permease LptF [Cereibacter sphaeroides]
MSRFDRYLLSQLMALFGFFSLILVAVYWVNRAVSLFDELIGDGQSALVVLEFTALTLPNVIRLVLPISAFVAAVYVANRLTQESELVVMQATGFSPWRLARPVFYFGLIVTFLVAILMNIVVPASRTTLATRSAEIEANVTARFLREGTFLHPTPGVTFYIRRIAATGELLEVFLSDARDPASHVTYSALRALVVRSDDGPKLIMFDGVAQTLDTATDKLTVTRFEDLTYDIGAFMQRNAVQGRSPEEAGTLDLLRASPALAEELGATRAELLREGHSRIGNPLLGLAAPLIGFSTLLLGAFSRFGLWRQVLGSVILLVIVQFADNIAAEAALANERLWPLAYAAPLLGLVIAAVLLWWASSPGRRGRAGRAAVPT